MRQESFASSGTFHALNRRRNSNSVVGNSLVSAAGTIWKCLNGACMSASHMAWNSFSIGTALSNSACSIAPMASNTCVGR